MHGQSVIYINTPYASQGLMVSFAARGNPQGGTNKSMGAPYSQLQMSQGGTTYLRGTSIPQPNNPYGNPHYTTIPQGTYYTMQPVYNIGNNAMGRLQGSSSHMSSPWSNSAASHTIPFLAMLDIPGLYKLTNDPMYHNLLWPQIPHKIPTNTPKFDGKQGEDVGTHITTYHLWSVSSSMVDDSIQLHLFPTPLLAMQLSGTLSYNARQSIPLML